MSDTLGIILIIISILGYILYRTKVSIKKDNVRKQKVDLIINKFRQSSCQYVVIIRTNDKIYKAFEDDKLGAVGYHIYKKYAPNIEQIQIYIIDNFENNIMKIEKDTDSECMIGVDDPNYGHIGYLSFVIVKRII